jgi:ketosteroid isomerase-like protein
MWYRMPVALMILTLTFVGWSAAQSNTDADVAGIKAFNQAYEKAIKADDTNAMVNMWDNDGVMLPPAEPAVVGASQIRAWLTKNRVTATSANISQDVTNWKDIMVSGDYGFQWGQTFVDIRSKDGSTGFHMYGTALQVLRKEPGGSWKLFRSSWSYEGRKKDKPAK